jgi:hypothetical protein
MYPIGDKSLSLWTAGYSPWVKGGGIFRKKRAVQEKILNSRALAFIFK